MFIVLDTSVVLKWFNQRDESNIKIARQIYNDLVSGKIEVMVPDILPVELLNVLIVGKKLPVKEVQRSIYSLFRLPMVMKEPTAALLSLTTEVANMYSITSYDALFVALAKDENCRLISDDNKAHGKVKDGTVIMLGQYT